MYLPHTRIGLPIDLLVGPSRIERILNWLVLIHRGTPVTFEQLDIGDVRVRVRWSSGGYVR